MLPEGLLPCCTTSAAGQRGVHELQPRSPKIDLAGRMVPPIGYPSQDQVYRLIQYQALHLPLGLLAAITGLSSTCVANLCVLSSLAACSVLMRWSSLREYSVATIVKTIAMITTRVGFISHPSQGAPEALPGVNLVVARCQLYSYACPSIYTMGGVGSGWADVWAAWECVIAGRFCWSV